MYFVVNPFFYYIANQDSIDRYLSIESNGELPYQMTYSKLRSIVESFVNNNSHGVDANKIDSYIDYICKKLCS